MSWMTIKEDVLRRQGKIALRYLPNYFITKNKDYTEIYDKFLHQILEEVYEFSIEDINSANALEEAYDILSYLGSLLIVTRYTWKVAYKGKDYTPPSFLKLYSNNIIQYEDETLFINNLPEYFVLNLYNLRRQFIERKWHYFHNNNFEISKIIIVERELLRIYEAFGFLISNFYGFDKFSEVFIRKANKNKTFQVQPKCVSIIYKDNTIVNNKIRNYFDKSKYLYRNNVIKEIEEL